MSAATASITDARWQANQQSYADVVDQLTTLLPVEIWQEFAWNAVRPGYPAIHLEVTANSRNADLFIQRVTWPAKEVEFENVSKVLVQVFHDLVEDFLRFGEHGKDYDGEDAWTLQALRRVANGETWKFDQDRSDRASVDIQTAISELQRNTFRLASMLNRWADLVRFLFNPFFMLNRRFQIYLSTVMSKDGSIRDEWSVPVISSEQSTWLADEKFTYDRDGFWAGDV